MLVGYSTGFLSKGIGVEYHRRFASHLRVLITYFAPGFLVSCALSCAHEIIFLEYVERNEDEMSQIILYPFFFPLCHIVNV